MSQVPKLGFTPAVNIDQAIPSVSLCKRGFSRSSLLYDWMSGLKVHCGKMPDVIKYYFASSCSGVHNLLYIPHVSFR